MTPGPVLVTGANGFVGRALVQHLCGLGVPVHAAVRQNAGLNLPTKSGCTVFSGLALDEHTDWSPALAGVQAVVHCAARVHVLQEQAADPLAEFRRVNVTGTLRLAAQAAQAGVRRFVFVSSIGVNGSQTQGRAFLADDPPAPHSAYAQSKLEGELALRTLCAQTDMALCIVRPPMVYGPGAPGNFATLLKALYRGLPLPLGSVHNQRSFVAVENLVDLLARCTNHPRAAGQVLLVSDGQDLSTTELLRCMAQGVGRPARLLPIPGRWLQLALRALGKAQAGQSLLGSLQVDTRKTRELLGWTPVISAGDALARAARAHPTALSAPSSANRQERV